MLSKVAMVAWWEADFTVEVEFGNTGLFNKGKLQTLIGTPKMTVQGSRTILDYIAFKTGNPEKNSACDIIAVDIHWLHAPPASL